MEELKEEVNWLEKLRRDRDHYIDEIPPEVVDSLSPSKNFKARKVWFQLVVVGLRGALQNGQITDLEVAEEAEKFIKHYTSEKFHHQALTTAEDIERGNRIINMALGEET